MGREIDRRNFGVNKVTKAREAELKSLASEVSDRLPGTHRVRIRSFDPTTGNPSMITSESAPAEKGNYIQRALNHVRSISKALGIKVGVDITHTFIGDLRVELVAPSGQQAILHNRTGGGQDNLIVTYDSISIPALAALVGQSVDGSWLLRVIDLAGRDIGKLNRWNLELSL